jgi:hypothetical protein
MIPCRMASVFFALTTLLASAGAGRPLPLDDEYIIQRVVKSGETDKYKTSLKIHGMGQMGPLDFEVIMVSNDRVSEVKPNGDSVVMITIESGTLTINGAERPFPGAGQTITMTYDKQGHTLSNSAPTSGRGSLIAQLLPLARMGYLTETPIKLGQSARYESEFGEGKKSKLSGLINLESVEKAGAEISVETVKVKNVADVVIPVASGEQKTHIESSGQVDPKNGKVYRSEGAITGGPLTALGADAKLTFKLTRMGSGEAGKPNAAGK